MPKRSRWHSNGTEAPCCSSGSACSVGDEDDRVASSVTGRRIVSTMSAPRVNEPFTGHHTQTADPTTTRNATTDTATAAWLLKGPHPVPSLRKAPVSKSLSPRNASTPTATDSSVIARPRISSILSR